MRDIPVIDVFAGPGGLNEGFSSFSSPELRFDVRLSIEKDPFACETLRMRSFFRQSRRAGGAPETYYEAVRGDANAMKRLRGTAAWRIADEHVRQWTLGEQDPKDVHTAIREKLADRKDWILLGGPPCQVYSVIGRARTKGIGSKTGSEEEKELHRKELERTFATDHRHTLYREYLEIVALHEPALFVMENVKGILSADLPIEEQRSGEWTYEPIFERIMSDLRDPAEAVRSDKAIRMHPGFPLGGKKYRLVSFVRPPDLFGETSNPSDFIIECERYGIPQKRHRVIILGIREDIDASSAGILKETGRPMPAKAMLKGLPKIRSALSKDAETRKQYGEDSDEGWQRAVRESIPKDVLVKIGGEARKRIADVLKGELNGLTLGGPYVKGNTRPPKDAGELGDFIHDERLDGAIQHESRAHMASDLGRYLYSSVIAEQTKASPKIDAWPLGLIPNHKNVKTKKGQDMAIVDAFKDRFRVQVWDQPASTVTAHVSKDGHYIIHPDPSQCRSLTVRELARLQTFPDNYYFAGPRTEQYHQVGNAVPPFLAFRLASVVAGILNANQAQPNSLAANMFKSVQTTGSTKRRAAVG